MLIAKIAGSLVFDSAVVYILHKSAEFNRPFVESHGLKAILVVECGKENGEAESLLEGLRPERLAVPTTQNSF